VTEEEQPEAEQPTERLDAPPTLVTPPIPVPGRNLKIAIATGLALAALVIGFALVSSKAFFGLAFVVIIFAQGEFYKSTRSAGYDPATSLGLAAGAVLLIGVFLKGPDAAGLVMFLTILFCLIWYIAVEPRADLLSDIAVTIFGVAYVPLLGSFAGLLAARPEDGGPVIIAVIGATAFYDIFAYAGGSRFGKTPLAPEISPKKTREGALVATAGTMILVTAVAPLLGPWNFAQAAVFAVLVSIAAPLGDLLESLIKRDLAIKDMGTLFPGHGGALDRIDAILFTLPVAYLSLVMFGL